MTQQVIMLICTGIAFGAVLIVEILKQVVKHTMKKKGKVMDLKKAEYLLAGLPIFLTFIVIYFVLAYYTTLQLEVILKICTVYSSGTQAIYTFGIQLLRKSFSGIVNTIHSFVTKKQDDTKSLPEQAEDMINAIKKRTEAEAQQKATVTITSKKSDDAKLDEFLKGLDK